MSDAIANLLGALDTQCFPNGANKTGIRCSYSTNVTEAMQRARDLVANRRLEPTDPRDLASPQPGRSPT